MGESQITRNNVINLWGRNYPEVMRWLGKLQKKDANCYHLYRFCQWANIDPKELLALKDNPASTRAEELLDDFVNDDTPQFTNAIKVNMVTAVKSFFKHNYKDLAKACGAIELVQKKEHKKPTKEDLRSLWNYTQNLRDKSLITFVNSTALAKETLSKLELRYFDEGWETKDLPYIDCPPEILKGHGVEHHSTSTHTLNCYTLPISYQRYREIQMLSLLDGALLRFPTSSCQAIHGETRTCLRS